MRQKKIQKIGCIGAGVIGHAWACAFAQRGYQVRLMDKNQELLRSVPEKIRDSCELFIKKGLLTQEGFESTLKRLKMGTEISWAVEGADFCIESVFEDQNLKKQVFAQMDKFAPAAAILASSTSGQSITEISRATARPERCIIIHPLNPPHIIPAVEVVRGQATSDETTTQTVELLKNIGRKPYVCLKEVPGFVMTRLLLVVFREALSLLKQGVANVKDIDTAINAGLGLRFGLMGIFEILNLTATGGLERFLEKYAPLCRQVWQDMEDLKDIPPDLAQKAIAGIQEELQGRSNEEIIRWRDEKLLELMKIRSLV